MDRSDDTNPLASALVALRRTGDPGVAVKAPEPIQEVRWYLIARGSDLTCRIQPGTRLGVDARGELEVDGADGLITLDANDDDDLVLKTDPDQHRFQVAGGEDATAINLTPGRRARIDLLGHSVCIDTELSSTGAPKEELGLSLVPVPAAEPPEDVEAGDALELDIPEVVREPEPAAAEPPVSVSASSSWQMHDPAVDQPGPQSAAAPDDRWGSLYKGAAGGAAVLVLAFGGLYLLRGADSPPAPLAASEEVDARATTAVRAENTAAARPDDLLPPAVLTGADSRAAVSTDALAEAATASETQEIEAEPERAAGEMISATDLQLAAETPDDDLILAPVGAKDPIVTPTGAAATTATVASLSDPQPATTASLDGAPERIAEIEAEPELAADETVGATEPLETAGIEPPGETVEPDADPEVVASDAVPEPTAPDPEAISRPPPALEPQLVVDVSGIESILPSMSANGSTVVQTTAGATTAGDPGGTDLQQPGAASLDRTQELLALIDLEATVADPAWDEDSIAGPMPVEEPTEEPAASESPSAAPDEASDALYPLSELTVIRMDAPTYPRRAPPDAEARIPVVFTISETGEVRDVQVEGAPPTYFERAARRAVRRWRFEPVQQDGKTISVRARVTLEFRG